MSFIKKHLRRLRFAFGGIFYGLRCDFSFRWQVIAAGGFLAVVGYFAWPLTSTEILFLLLAYALILITELQNSALEEALDHLHPELHDRIGRTKDMAAGSVLLAGFFAMAVSVTLLFF